MNPQSEFMSDFFFHQILFGGPQSLLFGLFQIGLNFRSVQVKQHNRNQQQQ